MAKSPFREERLPASEVRRIVTRAVELAPLHDPEAVSGQALTRRELEQRAADLGIPAAAIRHALESPSSTASAGGKGASAVVHDEELDGVLTVDGHEQVAEAIHAAMGADRGRVEVVGKKLTYRVTAYGDTLTVTVHTKNGRTRLRAEQAAYSRRQMAVFTLALVPLAVLPATIVFTATQSWVVAVMAAALVVALIHLALRALVVAAARKRAALAERATAAIRAALRQALNPPGTSARYEGRDPLRVVAADNPPRVARIDDEIETEHLASEEAAAAHGALSRSR